MGPSGLNYLSRSPTSLRFYCFSAITLDPVELLVCHCSGTHDINLSCHPSCGGTSEFREKGFGHITGHTAWQLSESKDTHCWGRFKEKNTCSKFKKKKKQRKETQSWPWKAYRVPGNREKQTHRVNYTSLGARLSCLCLLLQLWYNISTRGHTRSYIPSWPRSYYFRIFVLNHSALIENRSSLTGLGGACLYSSTFWPRDKWILYECEASLVFIMRLCLKDEVLNLRPGDRAQCRVLVEFMLSLEL